MARPWILALVALGIASGCQVPAARTARLRMASPDSVSARAELPHTRLARLGHGIIEGIPGIPEVEFRISDRDALGAWTWPSGEITITQALIELLDDAELSAVLAHEVGHLMVRASAQSALAEETGDQALELAADQCGCCLLARRSVRPDAMVSMLRKVASGLRNARALDRRIAAASRACGTGCE